MPRFALYYAPQSGTSLAQAASIWLGRNNVSFDCEQITPKELDRNRFRELTRDPYHYGFHGTLKPPFRLREGVSENQLYDELMMFCSKRKPFVIQELEISWIEKFLCLRPVKHTGQLNTLAGDTVQKFDWFRKPMSSIELEKRRGKGLTLVQDSLLLQWGYPYVLEEFRFHLTLSSNIQNPEERTILEDEARRYFLQHTLMNIPVKGVSLFVENETEPMKQLLYIPFGG